MYIVQVGKTKMIGHHDYLLTKVICVISVILFSSFHCPQELFFLKIKKTDWSRVESEIK